MTEDLRTLLLATDGSDDARLARRAVAALALESGAAVHVAGAWDMALPLYFPGYVATDGTVIGVEDQVRYIVAAERRELHAAGVPMITGHVRFGRPVDVILEIATEVAADLVVAGSRGHGPVARLVLGSVSESLVLAGRRPVLVMRGGDAAWPPPRIVAGWDGSRESVAAVRLAGVLGRCTGAPVGLVAVVPAAATARARTLGDAIEGDRARLERASRRLRERGCPSVTVTVAPGDPAAGLIAAAGESPPGLVVIGRRGIGRIRHALLGSVSTKVLHAAAGPVLVVPWAPARPPIDGSV